MLAGCVQLLEVYLLGGVLHLVLEFCPYDLRKVIYDKSIFLRTKHIKCYMTQILKAIQHCHAHFILHRGWNYDSHLCPKCC
jgi:serine/threonine protein kinase